jgi:ADP-ribose pyrophosphatase
MADATLVVESDELVDPPRAHAFLRLRSVALRVERPDGTMSERGVWELVERPHGLDAVVVIVWRRGAGGIEVLLRRGLRVPTVLGRPSSPRGPGRYPAELVEETVAGLVERDDASLAARALAEVEEEVGLTLAADRIVALGGPLWATPGMCAEVLFWFAADATGVAAREPAGDGSPFESVGEVLWRPLDEAIDACTRGELATLGSLGDLRAELGFRRLKALLEK